GVMFLKHYTNLSDEKLIDRINTDWAMQLFCGLLLSENEQLKTVRLFPELEVRLENKPIYSQRYSNRSLLTGPGIWRIRMSYRWMPAAMKAIFVPLRMLNYYGDAVSGFMKSSCSFIVKKQASLEEIIALQENFDEFVDIFHRDQVIEFKIYLLEKYHFLNHPDHFL
ncbi:MAG: transposase, partial [Bacteroidota bacterium]